MLTNDRVVNEKQNGALGRVEAEALGDLRGVGSLDRTAQTGDGRMDLLREIPIWGRISDHGRLFLSWLGMGTNRCRSPAGHRTSPPGLAGRPSQLRTQHRPEEKQGGISRWERERLNKKAMLTLQMT